MTRPSINRGFSDTFLAAVLAMAVAIALAIGLGTDARGAAIIGNYDLTSGPFTAFNNTSGSLGSLTVVGAGNQSFSGSGWSWEDATGNGIGLSIGGLPDNGAPTGTFGNYSIGMRFSLGQVSGFQRLILFKNNDFGPYTNGTTFEFVGGTAGGSISANSSVDFVLTRNAATKVVSGYLGGNSTAIFSFTDTPNDYGQTTSNRTLQFFVDDGSEFSPSGTASLIRIWDAPLDSSEIPNAMMPVPEPTTIALLAVSGGGAMLYLRRRRRSLR